MIGFTVIENILCCKLTLYLTHTYGPGSSWVVSNYINEKKAFLLKLVKHFVQGKENFEEALNAKLSEATEEQRKELCKMLSDHFDPDVVEAEVEKKLRNPRKSNRRSDEKDKDAGTSSDVPTTPETSASNTSTSSPSKSNGVITPAEKSPNHQPVAKPVSPPK